MASREELLEILPEDLLDAWWKTLPHGGKFAIAMLWADLEDGTLPDIEPLIRPPHDAEEEGGR